MVVPPEPGIYHMAEDRNCMSRVSFIMFLLNNWNSSKLEQYNVSVSNCTPTVLYCAVLYCTPNHHPIIHLTLVYVWYLSDHSLTPPTVLWPNYIEGGILRRKDTSRSVIKIVWSSLPCLTVSNISSSIQITTPGRALWKVPLHSPLYFRLRGTNQT